MARALSLNLDRAMFSERREPRFKLLVWDLRTLGSPWSISDIVLGTGVPSVGGPFDMTTQLLAVNVEDVAGDYLSSGVAAGSLTVTIVDENDIYDPFLTLDDPTGDGRWLRQGNAVRLFEGDARVDEIEWANTFTGHIVGQAGRANTRLGGGVRTLSFKALDRTAEFLGLENTTDSYQANTTYAFMGQDIAESDMGLDSGEIKFAGWGLLNVTGHTVTQMAKEPAIVSIAKCMFVDGFMPRFDGEGFLTQSAGIITAAADRVYVGGDESILLDIARPFSEYKPPDAITVVGLDADLSKVVQPMQEVANTQLTTGYFTRDERIDIYFSEDRSVLVDDPRLSVVTSVAGSIALGGGEEVTFIKSMSPLQEGYIGATLTISTGHAPTIMIFLTVTYVTLAVVPDIIVGFIAGTTISVGRLAQAAALAGVMQIMAKIGKGDYIWKGRPFEYVYQEIRGKAVAEGANPFGENQREVVNHLVQSQTDADNTAFQLLRKETVKGNLRMVRMLTDLQNEPDDTIQTSDTRRYLIAKISRTLQRGVDPVSTLSCFEVTEGVLP